MHYFDFHPDFCTKLADKPLARGLWYFLRTNVARMETATFYGHPALEAIQEELITEFGEYVQDDQCKTMIGRMARQIMEHHGYELIETNVKLSKPILFSTAALYRKK